MSEPEPWLRGPLEGVAPHVQPLIFTFQQVREDLAHFTAGLTDEQVWRDVDGCSIGFHLRHVAGTVERLSTYLFDRQLTEEQLADGRREHVADKSQEQLLSDVDAAFRALEARLCDVRADELFAARVVGRKRLPTTVLGLLVHISEHTQRHLGQIISMAKAVRREA